MTFTIRRLLLPVTLAGAAVAQDVPKADLFLGYSFVRFNQAQSIPAFTANGGVGTLGWNFNQYIGLEAELGGYHNGNINNHEFDTTTFSYLFGPRFSLSRARTVDPYLHTLFGGMNAHTSICCIAPTTGTGQSTAGTRVGRDQNNFAMAIGGGLDIKLGHRVLLRPIQLDYFLTRFQAPDLSDLTGPSSNRNQHDLRFAAGIAFNFGGESPGPPPPPTPPSEPKFRVCPGGASVAIDQECPKQNIGLNIGLTANQVCPGESSRATPSVKLPDGAVTQWSINGEPVSQGPTVEFGSTGREAGSYKVGLKVAAEGYNDASAEATVNVRPYTPLTGALTASPAEIWAGEKATLSASFSPGQCGGPVGEIAYSATEGTVNGREFDSSTVRFDPADGSEQRKTITITAKASDQRGSASADASLVVKQRAATQARRLPDVIFPVGSERVNNCGKRVLLEELKSAFESDPGGSVVFVGHTAENESASGLDLRRALNGAAIISAGQGICARFPASQILIKTPGAEDNAVDFKPHFCGTSTEVAELRGQAVEQSDAMAKYRRVEVWFVPSGGAPPTSAKDSKSALTLGVGNLGCPK